MILRLAFEIAEKTRLFEVALGPRYLFVKLESWEVQGHKLRLPVVQGSRLPEDWHFNVIYLFL